MTTNDLIAVALGLVAANIGLWALYKWLTDPPKED